MAILQLQKKYPKFAHHQVSKINYKSMIQNLKPIDQTGIKALIKERIENPQKYVNTPLIIWRAPYTDGIQERILDDAFDEYNSNMSKEDRKFYRVSILPDDSQISYDFTTPDIIRTDVKGDAYGKYNFGLLVIDPVFAFMRPKEDALDMYYSAINNRKVGDVTLLPDVPVVALMSNNHDWFETPGKYPDAEQYVFQPDFDEWAEWAVSKGGFPQLFIDFIRGNGEKDGITYRWYNYFNATTDGKSAGCYYPEDWNKVRIYQILEMNRMNVDSFLDLNEEQLKKVCKRTNHISEDVKDAFCKYITKHKG